MVVFASVSNETNECVFVPAGDRLSPDPLQDRGLRHASESRLLEAPGNVGSGRHIHGNDGIQPNRPLRLAAAA
ncbi:hypothetical protein QQF64_001792 [Cirrhinus molitorella]|uniref:Uncharacterized protein n=1 Tax=Cirrhinus molitorella TaxID=172907 RepID=A0ABR3MNB3_9TELE